MTAFPLLLLAGSLACAPDLAGPPVPSEAEKIARLQRAIEADEKQLGALEDELAKPKGEYQEALSAFQGLDDKFGLKKKAVQRLKDLVQKPVVASLSPAAAAVAMEVAAAELAGLEKQWKKARERFDLAVQERKTRSEKVSTLQKKLAQDRDALARLLGTPASAGKSQPCLLSSILQDVGKTGCQTCFLEGIIKQAATARPPPGAAVVSPQAAGATGSRKERDDKENRRLELADDAARLKAEAARAAGDKATTLTERLTELRHAALVESRLHETLQKRAELAHEEQLELEKEQAARKHNHAPVEELVEGRKQIAAAAERYVEASAESRQSLEQLSELQRELAEVEAEHAAAAREAEETAREADAAQRELADLQNPFTLRNILQWMLNHLPKMGVVLACMWMLNRLVALCGRRIVRYLAEREHSKRLDTEDRAETLVGVFRNSATLAILGGGTLMLLDEAGIPIGPLMGSAAVLGLAVAFGAQNLIRDYFAGFMVLLEDQYGVNDVVKINSLEGKVERITLRMTVLRDMEGTAHFVPHGTITSVSNMTHSWSQAVLSVGVAYKEDVDRVMGVLMGLAGELRHDPAFAPLILEDPEMLGVDALGDSAVKIKFSLKTRPMKQWKVKRELLRRIKKRFDELGIEIPFPQQTVYHRYDPADVRRDGPGMTHYAA